MTHTEQVILSSVSPRLRAYLGQDVAGRDCSVCPRQYRTVLPLQSVVEFDAVTDFGIALLPHFVLIPKTR